MSQERDRKSVWNSRDNMVAKDDNLEDATASQGWSELCTLSKGRNATTFYWKHEGDGVTIHAGPQAHLSNTQIDGLIARFRDRDWFPLGASMTTPTPGSLGEYFRTVLGQTPRYSSHFAAVLVHQGRLATMNRGRAIYLKVVQ